MFMENYKDKATFVLRLFLGVAFIVAGLHKLTHLEGVGGMFAGLFGGAGTLLLWLTLVVELVGGAMLLVGYQTRWSATALAGIMIVALFTTWKISEGADFFTMLNNIFIMGPGNMSTNIAMLAGLLSLAMSGSEEMAVRPE